MLDEMKCLITINIVQVDFWDGVLPTEVLCLKLFLLPKSSIVLKEIGLFEVLDNLVLSLLMIT